MKRVKTKDDSKLDAGQPLKPDAGTGDVGPASPMPAVKDSDSQGVSSASETSRSSSAASGEITADEEVTPSPRDHVTFPKASKDVIDKDTFDKDTVDTDNTDKNKVEENNVDKKNIDKKSADKDSIHKTNDDVNNSKTSNADNETAPDSDKNLLSGVASISDKDENLGSDADTILSDNTDAGLSVTPAAKDAAGKSWNPFAKAVSSVSDAITNAISTARSSLTSNKADKKTLSASTGDLSIATVTSDNADKRLLSVSTGDLPLVTVTSDDADKRITSISADNLPLVTVTSDNAEKRIISATTDVDKSLATVASDNAEKIITSVTTDVDKFLATVTSDDADKAIISTDTTGSSLATVANDNKPSSWLPADEPSRLKSDSDQGHGKVKEVRSLLIDFGDSTEEQKVETGLLDDVTKASSQRYPVVMNQSSFDDDESNASSPADVVTPNYVMTPESYFKTDATTSDVTSSQVDFSEKASLSKANTHEATWKEANTFEDNWSKASSSETSLPAATLSDAWTSDMVTSNVMTSSVMTGKLTSTGVISTDALQADLVSWNVESPTVTATSTGVIETSQPKPADFALSDAVKPMVTSSVPYNGVIDDATKEDVGMSFADEFSLSQSLKK